MSWLQRVSTLPILWAGMVVVLGYFAYAVLSSIFERHQR